jgi:hypothetical protein
MTVRETGAFALLKKHLFALALGEIAETGRVTALLAGCWHQFVGAESQRMHAGKLGRMEDVSWAPPVLSLRIEQHGRWVWDRLARNSRTGASTSIERQPNANAAAAIARRRRAQKESG